MGHIPNPGQAPRDTSCFSHLFAGLVEVRFFPRPPRPCLRQVGLLLCNGSSVSNCLQGLNSEKGPKWRQTLFERYQFHFGQNGSGLVEVQTCGFLGLPTPQNHHSVKVAMLAERPCDMWPHHVSKSRVSVQGGVELQAFNASFRQFTPPCRRGTKLLVG